MLCSCSTRTCLMQRAPLALRCVLSQWIEECGYQCNNPGLSEFLAQEVRTREGVNSQQKTTLNQDADSSSKHMCGV
jgi:hypothetical protein|eukprot:COSAG06_NODE_4559_length_4145_cov_2.655957_3_plen_76_part_00